MKVKKHEYFVSKNIDNLNLLFYMYILKRVTKNYFAFYIIIIIVVILILYFVFSYFENLRLRVFFNVIFWAIINISSYFRTRRIFSLLWY